MATRPLGIFRFNRLISFSPLIPFLASSPSHPIHSSSFLRTSSRCSAFARSTSPSPVLCRAFIFFATASPPFWSSWGENVARPCRPAADRALAGGDRFHSPVAVIVSLLRPRQVDLKGVFGRTATRIDSFPPSALHRKHHRPRQTRGAPSDARTQLGKRNAPGRTMGRESADAARDAFFPLSDC